jgi:hypothetical protein
MARKSTNSKVKHKHPNFYPIVLLPVLIQEHLPRQTIVKKFVPIENRSAPTRSSAPAHGYSLQVKYLALTFLAAVMAIVLRFLNVYTHNGIAVASVMLMALALVFLGKQMDSEEAAIAARQRKTAPAAPQFQTIEVKQWQVADWQTILIDRVKPHIGVSTAQVGASEADFAKYLQKYFGATLKPSYTFSIPDSDLVYSADFCLVLPSGLSFCLEIDEPYVYKTGEPHHCIDQGKDEQRDKFFLAGNWVTIRFSEKQVVLQPVACCFLIAKTVAQLTGDMGFVKQFDGGTKTPNLEPQWTIAEAEAMAKANYRDSYLNVKPQAQKSAREGVKLEIC